MDEDIAFSIELMEEYANATGTDQITRLADLYGQALLAWHTTTDDLTLDTARRMIEEISKVLDQMPA